MSKKIMRKITMLALTAAVAASGSVHAIASEVAMPVEAIAAPEPVRVISGDTATPDESMETALIAVKSLINLDDDVFTDFSYHSSYSNQQTREGLTWSFYWNDSKNGFVHASATDDGVLLEYRMRDSDAKYFGFAEINKQAATAAADAFVRAANPGTYSYYKAPTDISIRIGDSDYRISYTAEVNGRHFNAAAISVNVNKFTGAVTGYSTRNTNPGNFRFDEASPIISESAAIAAYTEKIGLSLEYMTNYDWQEGTITVFPAYMFKSSGDRFISAKTGDVVELVYDRGIYIDDYTLASAPVPEAAESDAGFGRQDLTPAEIEALERVSELITGEQALAKLLEITELNNLETSAFDQRNISLRRDHFDKERFFYDINLWRWSDNMKEDDISNLTGTVNADSGRVVRFSLGYNFVSQPFNEDTAVFSVSQAEAAVDAFLRKHAPNELASTRLDSGISDTSAPTAPEVRISRWGGNYSFQYVRYANDIPYRDNGISVSVDQNTGKIMSYSLNWFENISFPGLSGVLTPNQALTAYAAQNGSDIYYITAGEGNAALVYDFVNRSLINPFTGKAMDYSGEPWSEAEINEPDYDDVKGHWSESFVTKLLDNGVFLWGGPFLPDKTMTQAEFLEFIMLAGGSYYPIVPLQEFVGDRTGIDVDPDKILTRQEAARIIVEYLGHGKVAERSEWFVYPFKDAVDDGYKGHITIAYILGIIGGDPAGNYNAAGNVTRAHAAVILTNLINSRS